MGCVRIAAAEFFYRMDSLNSLVEAVQNTLSKDRIILRCVT